MAIALALALGACGPTSAAKTAPIEPESKDKARLEDGAAQQSHPCDIRAFSRPAAAISVETDQGQREDASGTHGVLFHITEQRGDRLHYDSVELLDEDASAPSAGWLSADDVTVNLNMSEVSPALMPPRPVHLYPDRSTALAPVHTYYQEAVTTRLVGCHGDWAHVRVVDADHTREGWLRSGDHCGNPVTACMEPQD